MQIMIFVLCVIFFLILLDIFVTGLQFIHSRYGNVVVQLGKYKFRKHSSSGAKSRWICNSDQKGCRSKLWIVDNEVVYYKSEHNH